MVAIKDFGMPSCCENCNINKFDYLGSQGTAHWNCAITENECEDYENKRNLDCPLVEIEERKVGKWIKYEKEFTESGTYRQIKRPVIECSICLEKIAGHIGIMKYCPNCGAEMEGEE